MKMTLLKKYIPKTWDEIVGQDEIIDTLQRYNSIEKLPHLAFIGVPGVGKTATAHVIAKALDVPLVELNASDERGIDVVRNKIKTLLATSGARIILLDEMDSTTDAAQNALRRPMEKAYQNTNNRLILTINRQWKIIEPILSRCANFYFKPLSDGEIKKILLRVFKGEKFSFSNKEELLKIINNITEVSNGDARKALNLTEKVITDKSNALSALEREVKEVNLAKETIYYAIEGDFEKTLRTLENVLLKYQMDTEKVVSIFWKELEELQIEPAKKFPLYRYLADTERALKLQTNPLVQFSGFLMSIIAVTHS